MLSCQVVYHLHGDIGRRERNGCTNGVPISVTRQKRDQSWNSTAQQSQFLPLRRLRFLHFHRNPIQIFQSRFRRLKTSLATPS